MTRIIEKIIARRKQRGHINTYEVEEDNSEPLSSSQIVSPPPPPAAAMAAMAGSNNAWYYSFEFFPPKTEAGLDNLLTRIDR